MKVVCVGAGWVTRTRHVPALAADPRVEILGIVDPSAGRAAEAAAAAGLRHSGTSLDESWVGAADAVTIGTPPLAHGIECATMSSSRLFATKPLCRARSLRSSRSTSVPAPSAGKRLHSDHERTATT